MKKLIVLIALIVSANLAVAEYPAGKVVVEYLYSASLENELGENPTRRITIYLPAGYEETTDRYPVLYYLHGGSGWCDSLQIADDQLDKLLDQAIALGKIKPVILVIPNHQNKYGTPWYTNSSLGGNWTDFTAIDLVAHIDKNYRTIPERSSRGVVGHSMGGFGSIRLGMLYSDVFSAVYALSPAFLVFPPVEHVLLDPNIRRVFEFQTIEELLTYPNNRNLWGLVSMGRAFTPNPDNPPFYVDLPFTLIGDSLVVNETISEQWLQNSPFEMVDHYAKSLNGLTALKLDWGRNDESGIEIPIECLMFSQKLENLGIPHYAEEYLGAHSDKLWTDDGRALNSMLPFFDRYLAFE